MLILARIMVWGIGINMVIDIIDPHAPLDKSITAIFVMAFTCFICEVLD